MPARCGTLLAVEVLAVTAPAVGHVLPMAPLLEAMVADGDVDVTVACDESVRAHVDRTGAAFLQACGASRGGLVRAPRGPHARRTG